MSNETAAAFSLLSAAAVRERSQRMLALALDNKLANFSVDLSRLDAAADRVIAVTRQAYPSLQVPFHSRWRHFAVDGVDVIFVGPGDLSVSIDAIGPKGADKLNEAIGTIIRATIAHNKVAGIFCASPQNIGRWAAFGASFFVLASDTMFLGAGAAANCAAARDELA